MSSKCTAAKAYDILGIYDFPDNFDALNGLHSYLYTNSDMVVEALASQKYDLARDIVTAIETVDKDGSYDDCAFYVSRDGIRILRTAEELIDALGDENGKTASTLLAKNGINVYAEGFQEIGSLFGREGAGVGFITSVLELALKRVRKSLMRVRHPLTSKARFFPPASREPSKNPSPIKQRFPKENARLSTFWLLMSERIRPEMT